MEIVIEQAPHVGQDFSFSIIGGIGNTKIEAFIDDILVFQNDCPDPPCHEMLKIPIGKKSSKLRIIAKDSLGFVSEKTFVIAEIDREAGGTMSAGA